MRVLGNRMERKLDEFQNRDQVGFRKGFSTIDHIHTMKQLIEKAEEYQQKICITFIDYEKASDSLEHKDMIENLQEAGLENAYINIIRDIYQRNSKNIFR